MKTLKIVLFISCLLAVEFGNAQIDFNDLSESYLKRNNSSTPSPALGIILEKFKESLDSVVSFYDIPFEEKSKIVESYYSPKLDSSFSTESYNLFSINQEKRKMSWAVFY